MLPKEYKFFVLYLFLKASCLLGAVNIEMACRMQVGFNSLWSVAINNFNRLSCYNNVILL